MAEDRIRLILPIVYLSGDERLDPQANASTPLDFTSLLNFNESLTEDQTLLPTIQLTFPFVEAIELFWLLERPVFRVTLSVDLTANYPAQPPSAPDPHLITIQGHEEWPLNVGNATAFYRFFNRLFYVPAGNWNRVYGTFYIPLTLTDNPNAVQPIIDFLSNLYEWSDGGDRNGRQGGGGP